MENGPAFLGRREILAVSRIFELGSFTQQFPEATASTDRTAKIWCADSGECALAVAATRGHLGRAYVDANSVKTGPFLNTVEYKLS